MEKILSVMFGFILLLACFVVAAPAEWGIALNHETKECINFWPGDEFSSNKLPEGFEFYTPMKYNPIVFEIGIGSCEVESNSYNDYSACCEQLGYFFIEDVEKEESFVLVVSVILGLVFILALIIYFIKKER